MWKRCNCLKLLYLFVLLGATKYVAKITHQGSHKSCFSNKGSIVLSMFGCLFLHLFFINIKKKIYNSKQKKKKSGTTVF
jgi:hypothetical protein